MAIQKRAVLVLIVLAVCAGSANSIEDLVGPMQMAYELAMHSASYLPPIFAYNFPVVAFFCFCIMLQSDCRAIRGDLLPWVLVIALVSCVYGTGYFYFFDEIDTTVTVLGLMYVCTAVAFFALFKFSTKVRQARAAPAPFRPAAQRRQAQAERQGGRRRK